MFELIVSLYCWALTCKSLVLGWSRLCFLPTDQEHGRTPEQDSEAGHAPPDEVQWQTVCWGHWGLDELGQQRGHRQVHQGKRLRSDRRNVKVINQWKDITQTMSEMQEYSFNSANWMIKCILLTLFIKSSVLITSILLSGIINLIEITCT